MNPDCVNLYSCQRLAGQPPDCETCSHFVSEEDATGDFISGGDVAILLWVAAKDCLGRRKNDYPGQEEE